MGRKRKNGLSEEKRNIIGQLIEMYDIKTAADIQEALKDLLGGTIQNMLETELEEQMEDREEEDPEYHDSRNGYKHKTLRSSMGEIPIQVPQDRNSDFEPQVVPKYKKDISEIEGKIIAMYARGMSVAQVSEQIKDIYGFEVSEGMVTAITNKLLPEIEAWQKRPLSAVYPIVYIDAMVFNMRENNVIRKAAAYVILGINEEGRKEVLSITIGENESAKFWLSILNGLKNRGVEDILIACVDGLTGFPQAIEAVFPQTEIQQCIIHQIRNTTKFVSYKEIKPLMADLKRVYGAPTEEIALAELDSFDEKWSGKYPKIAKSWKDNWANLSTYFKYPEAVRRLIYTTNAIEGFNRQLRKVTKSKTVFPSDDSLLKMLYLAMMDITKKWTGHRQDWGQIHSQLEIFFEERLSGL